MIPVISGGVLASLPGQAQVPSGWRGHVGLFFHYGELVLVDDIYIYNMYIFIKIQGGPLPVIN